jgi:MFS family permease
MPAERDTAYRIVTDAQGRKYRVGESPEQILGGRSRAWMMWLPWVAMLAISVFEYGFGAASDTLKEHNHWSTSQTFWIVTLWAVAQPAVAFPAGRLRETGALPVRTAMLLAAICAGIGFVTLAHTSSVPLVILGYSVIGGLGGGLAYAGCINIVGKWFPEKRGARIGFVNGGFAYGAVPFIFVFQSVFEPANFSLVLDLIALYVAVVVGLCAVFFKDPPKDWWPAEVDPLEWAEKTRRERLRGHDRNPPAVAQFTPMQAMRTGQMPLMWLALWMIGNTALFGTAYQVPFAKSVGFGALVAASSAGVFSVINGVGRAAVGWVSDQIGRKQTLIVVLLVEAFAQVGVLLTGKAHLEVPFLAMAFLAGFGSGAFFPLFAAMVPDYFGENHNATNYGIVYSAKLASSLVGIGIGSSVITAMGYTSAYLMAAALALVSVVVALFLRQPQRVPAMTAAPAVEAAEVQGGTLPEIAG